MDGPEGKELRLIGVFETNSAGPKPRQPELLPLPPAQRRLAGLPLFARHRRGRDLDPGRPGVDHLLLQPPAGPGDRRQGPRRHGRPGQGRLHLQDARRRHPGRQGLGSGRIAIDPHVRRPQDHCSRPHKDGRLVMEIERKKGDAELTEPDGWLAKKTKWVRIFETIINDKRRRRTRTDRIRQPDPRRQDARQQFVGWMISRTSEWVEQPGRQRQDVLQSLGIAKDEAECIMGGAVGKSWRLVSLPFRDEYPGGRQWNLDAAQFRLSARGPGARPDAAASPLGQDFRPHRRRTDARAARASLGADRPTSRPGPTICGRGSPAPSAIPSSRCPTSSCGATRTVRQEHPPRGTGTPRDQGRRQGGQGVDQQQRIQRRIGRRDHLCGRRKKHLA